MEFSVLLTVYTVISHIVRLAVEITLIVACVKYIKKG